MFRLPWYPRPRSSPSPPPSRNDKGVKPAPPKTPPVPALPGASNPIATIQPPPPPPLHRFDHKLIETVGGKDLSQAVIYSHNAIFPSQAIKTDQTQIPKVSDWNEVYDFLRGGKRKPATTAILHMLESVRIDDVTVYRCFRHRNSWIDASFCLGDNPKDHLLMLVTPPKKQNPAAAATTTTSVRGKRQHLHPSEDFSECAPFSSQQRIQSLLTRQPPFSFNHRFCRGDAVRMPRERHPYFHMAQFLRTLISVERNEKAPDSLMSSFKEWLCGLLDACEESKESLIGQSKASLPDVLVIEDDAQGRAVNSP